MFIKVTCTNGKPFIINTERIMCIEPSSTKKYGNASTIVFNENSFIEVCEDPDMIMNLIERSENGKS